MAGGLVQVISYGNQDIMLTGNPEITFFNIIYRRYTNFGKKIIEIGFDNDINFGNTSIITIPKNIGDLLSKLTLKIKLPKISTEIINSENLENLQNTSNIKIDNNSTYILYYDFYVSFYNNLLNITNIFFNKNNNNTLTYIADLGIFIQKHINSDKYQQFYTIIDFFFNTGLISKQNSINTSIYTNASLFKEVNSNYIYIYQNFKESDISYEQFKFTISKNMDILNELNTILYNKLINNIYNQKSIKVSWINKIGIYLFNSIELYIGSNKICNISDYYINNYGDLFYKNPEVYNKIIGNNQDINLFDINKDESYLYLPIPLWFNDNYGLAFPLISLQFNTLQVRINLKKFIDCIKIYIDDTLNTSDLQNSILKSILENESSIIKSNLEVTMLGEFIYLDSIERKKFAQSAHEYLITQVQEIEFYDLTVTNNSFNLDFFHCCKDIYWLAVKEPNMKDIFVNQDAQSYSLNKIKPFYTDEQNKFINYINILYKPDVYFSPNYFIEGRSLFNNTIFLTNSYNFTETYLLLIYNNFNNTYNIIEKSGLYLNGTTLINQYNNFFNYVIPYKYYNSVPEIGLYSYSFCLNPTESQPSGSINLSRIPSFNIRLTINPIINEFNPFINDNLNKTNNIKYKLIVQVTNYNVLRFIGGIAATAYTY